MSPPKTSGGGLFNYEGATATLTNVTLSGNEAKVHSGGGICNYGTLTLDGVRLTRFLQPGNKRGCARILAHPLARL